MVNLKGGEYSLAPINSHGWQPAADREPTALAHLERLTDTRQKLAAAREEFDPVHTFVSELNCDWNGHPRGSRVMLDDQQVAIETREAKSRAATSNA